VLAVALQERLGLLIEKAAGCEVVDADALSTIERSVKAGEIFNAAFV
jgi:hypothetical protein